MEYLKREEKNKTKYTEYRDLRKYFFKLLKELLISKKYIIPS